MQHFDHCRKLGFDCVVIGDHYAVRVRSGEAHRSPVEVAERLRRLEFNAQFVRHLPAHVLQHSRMRLSCRHDIDGPVVPCLLHSIFKHPRCSSCCSHVLFSSPAVSGSRPTHHSTGPAQKAAQQLQCSGCARRQSTATFHSPVGSGLTGRSNGRSA